MPKKWTEIESNPEFQTLDPETKAATQAAYFRDVLAPQLADAEIEPTREAFYSQFQYGNEPDTAFLDIGDTASGVWDAARGMWNTAPAAYHQLSEGLVRPDQYSPESVAARDTARAYGDEMSAKRRELAISGEGSTVGNALREAGPSMGFSAGSMGAGIAGRAAAAGTGALIGAAVPGLGETGLSEVGGAVIGFLSSAGASGVAAYRMAGSQFLEDAFYELNKASQQKFGRPMNEQEMQEAYSALLPVAQDHALWEAGPEAIGNAVQIGLGPKALGIGKPLFSELAKSALGRAAGRLGAAGVEVGTELGTETLTQLGQGLGQAKMEAYVQGQPMESAVDPYAEGGWKQALKDVAPATLATMGLLHGGAKTAHVASQIILGKANEEVVTDPALPAPAQEALSQSAQLAAAAQGLSTAGQAAAQKNVIPPPTSAPTPVSVPPTGIVGPAPALAVATPPSPAPATTPTASSLVPAPTPIAIDPTTGKVATGTPPTSAVPAPTTPPVQRPSPEMRKNLLQKARAGTVLTPEEEAAKQQELEWVNQTQALPSDSIELQDDETFKTWKSSRNVLSSEGLLDLSNAMQAAEELHDALLNRQATGEAENIRNAVKRTAERDTNPKVIMDRAAKAGTPISQEEAEKQAKDNEIFNQKLKDLIARLDARASGSKPTTPTPTPAPPTPSQPPSVAPKAPNVTPAVTSVPPTTPSVPPVTVTAPEPRRGTPNLLKRALRSRAFKTHPTVAGDIISQTQENVTSGIAPPKIVTVREGGKRVLKLAPESQTADWNWLEPILQDPAQFRALQDTLFAEGSKVSLDQAASHFQMTPDQYGQALLAATQERSRIAQELSAGTGEASQSVQAEQADAFRDATKSGKQEVSTHELEPGDALDIGGEQVAVTGVVTAYDSKTGKATLRTATGQQNTRLERAEVGDVVLEDGARFGRQTMTGGDSIWVEKFEPEGGERLAFSAEQAPEQPTGISEKEGDARSPSSTLPTAEKESGVGIAKEEEAPSTSDKEGEQESPQPNPLQPFSAAPKQRILFRGISKEDLTAAIKALQRLLPNIRTAWSGTRKELEKHLRVSQEFQSAWKRGHQTVNPSISDEQAASDFEDMLTNGLNGKEGFTFKGRTYLITDQIAVRESDQTAANAARRVLIHEDAHEGLRHLRNISETVENKWQSFRDAIPAADLDALAKTKYTWLQDWRNNSLQHDEIADEWFAARIAEIETRGEPGADTLVGKFLKWIKGLYKKLSGQEEDPTNRALLEFMDAARTARFRDRAESGAEGLRYTATNNDGDLPPNDVFQNDLENQEATAGEIAPQPGPSRYELTNQDRKDKYQKYLKDLSELQSDPAAQQMASDLTYFTQFLGNPTENKRLTQKLANIVDFARHRLGGINGERPEVSEDNTELAWNAVRQLLTNPFYSRDYQQDFQDSEFSPKDEQGRPMHLGDAAAAVLQLEVMDYAARLARTGNTAMMSSLAPFANDVILGDYATMSGAARMLQARSQASRSTGIWQALREHYQAAKKAVLDALGQEGADELSAAIETSKNPEANADATKGVQKALEGATGQAVLDAVDHADEENPSDGYFRRVMESGLLDAEELAKAALYDEKMRRLDRLVRRLKTLEAKAGSQIKASVAEDADNAIWDDPEALRAAIAQEVADIKGLLKDLTKGTESAESSTKRKSRGTRHKDAYGKLNEDQQAKELLKRYENRSKRSKTSKPTWRKVFDDQVRNPKSLEDFQKAIGAGEYMGEKTAKKLFELAGKIQSEREARKKSAAAKTKIPATQEEQAQRAAEAFDKKLTGTAKPTVAGTPRGPRLTDIKAFLNHIAQRILDAPIRLQEDPTWKKETVIGAFLDRGMTLPQAQAAATKFVGLVDRALKEAQARAALKALEKIKKAKKLDNKKISEAIRTRGFDPLHPDPAVAAVAAEAGYAALTPEQFQRLAELDAQTSELPNQAAKAYAEMARILTSARPRKTVAQIAVQSWVNSALSSLSVVFLNWVHPIYIMLRRAGTDTADMMYRFAAGTINRGDALKMYGNMVRNWFNALSYLRSEGAFALKNDAYSNRMLDMLSNEHRMMQEFWDGYTDFTKGTPKEKVNGAVKMLFTSTDLMRRLLASADQMWGGVLQQYIIQNEGMRILTERAGMSVEAAATILNSATQAGQAAMSNFIAHGGNPTEAILVGKDTMQDALKRAVAKATGDEETSAELEVTAEKESSMELGNRLSEEGPWLDLVNLLLEGLKLASSSIRKKNELFGRMLTGFITVGANILNRSAYFTPIGIGRALYKMKSDRAKAENFYSETMATEGQTRMRMVEGVVGTMAMILLMLLRKDKDDKDGLVITGEGPSDRGVKDAMEKRGYKWAHIGWVHDGKMVFGIPYSRGGFDHMALPLTFVGALDDVELDGHKGDKKNASFAWSYGSTVVGNLANQARFFGMKNLVSSVPTSLKDSSIAGNVSYTAAPFIPWSGLLKSTTRLFTGKQDQSSWQSAVLAQMPVVNAFTGSPQLNYLGDPVGPDSTDFTTHAAERLSFAGAPFWVGIDVNSRNAKVYRFLATKGIAPSFPMRGRLESDNGFISDSKWARYVKTRGRYIKDTLQTEMNSIQFMPQDEAKEAMETVTRNATIKAKRELGLK